MSLDFYINSFKNLNVDKHNERGLAPHKPVLLLSIIDLFEKGVLTSSKVEISPDLVMSFKTIWAELVESDHNANFALPFFHMKSEKFWLLVPKYGCELWVKNQKSFNSINTLNIAVDFALLDESLTDFLLNPESRVILKKELLEHYFKGKKDIESKYSFREIETELLSSTSNLYADKMKAFERNLSKSEFTEEVFIRGSLFKREVPKIYSFSCAISGMQLSTLKNISMIDACHIVPFSESYDDTIGNGIALSPNLHRAFDRGLISIDENYKVLVSSSFKENLNSPFSIRQFEGTQILLPKKENLYPSQVNLKNHRARFGFT